MPLTLRRQRAWRHANASTSITGHGAPTIKQKYLPSLCRLVPALNSEGEPSISVDSLEAASRMEQRGKKPTGSTSRVYTLRKQSTRKPSSARLANDESRSRLHFETSLPSSTPYIRNRTPKYCEAADKLTGLRDQLFGPDDSGRKKDFIKKPKDNDFSVDCEKLEDPDFLFLSPLENALISRDTTEALEFLTNPHLRVTYQSSLALFSRMHLSWYSVFAFH